MSFLKKRFRQKVRIVQFVVKFKNNFPNLSMINKDLYGNREEPLYAKKKPNLKNPDSQLVTASQLYEETGQYWCEILKKGGVSPQGVVMDRKVWEYCFILQAISNYAGNLQGKKGIAFGCGFEIMPSYFASRGSKILVTDLIDQKHDWQASCSNQLHFKSIINKNKFEERVSFKNVNMNRIPSDIRDFDYCWSCGSLEHIGSHKNGIKFLENSLETLKPGGISVHTTEFTLTSDVIHYDQPDLSFYCKDDIEKLATNLISKGHKIVLNFQRGETPADSHVDTPDSSGGFHYGRTLLAHMNTHVITSIGLIIQKGN